MYTTVDEVFRVAAKISEDLDRTGNRASAEEIRQTLRTFWTTSTEALGELQSSLGKALEMIAGTVGAEVREDIAELQKACGVLMNLS